METLITNQVESLQGGMNDNTSHNDLASIINYWENKRIIYNITLLIVGLSAIFAFADYSILGEGSFLLLIVLYGGFANIFYSFGPYLNVLSAEKLHFLQTPWKLGFYFGLSFSILLTINTASVYFAYPIWP